MQTTSILWPVAVQILLTLLIFIPLTRRKFQAVKDGTDVSKTALNNSAWPDNVLKASNNLANQFQLPVLFYVLCLIFFVTNGVSVLVLALAWTFVVSRLVHSYVHITTNYVPHRMRIFILGYLVLILMTIILISQLALG